MHGRLLLAFLLFLLPLAVFSRVLGNDFVNFDDDVYVTANRLVQRGLSAESIEWAFAGSYAYDANYHPLTWLSHMLDVELFGGDPAGHHATSVVLHALNTVVLFWVLASMTRRLARSAFVAALFAVHPLHVESVAWIAERKDVLSTLFWLLATAAYVHYARRPRATRMLLVAVLLALGLLAKPMLVTLPFVLLLLDWWPLRRWRFAGRDPEPDAVLDDASLACPPPTSAVVLVLEKLPLFALVGASCLVTFHVQAGAGAVRTLEDVPLGMRLANAAMAYVSYVTKTFWPAELAVYYPHPGTSLDLARAFAAGALLLAGTAALVWIGIRRPPMGVGWLWYIGTLFPVCGIVQLGSHALADRYTYVPLIGVFIVLAWGVPGLAARLPQRRSVLIAGSLVIIAACSVASWHQAGLWRDSITLFEHTLAHTERNFLAHNRYGIAIGEKGRVSEAEQQFREAIHIAPRFPQSYNNLAVALLRQGRFGEAVEVARTAVRLDPSEPKTHNNLGIALANKGNLEEAIRSWREALRLDAGYVEACVSLAAALRTHGESDEALEHLREATRLDPRHATAHHQLGRLLLDLGRPAEALDPLRHARELAPANNQVRQDLERAERAAAR
ncbi:MAG: tetratricopeptide repeat protein [Planctomycetota bacterium]